MKNKTLLLSIICIFLISISASYASNVSDNINYNSNEVSTAKDSNTSSITKSSNLKNNSVKLLAAGEGPNKISQEDILSASERVNTHISKNGKLPNYVTISDYKVSMPEFMYMLAKTIQYKYKNIDSDVTARYDINDPSKPQGTDIKGTISVKNYYDYTTRVANYIVKHNTAPNFVRTTLGRMPYQTTIYSFIKILEGINGDSLPSKLSINVKKTNKLNKYKPSYTNQIISKSKSLNDKYSGESLEPYLTATKNCQVFDSTIQALSYKLTKDYTTTRQKASAIFNWVKNNINYVFYYNTKYGAKNALSKKTGNCVDQAHLFIALCRASNIPTRYVHGQCKFTSGRTYGHVWAQVLIGETWTIADTTSSKNSLGVINNWNSYNIHAKYDALAF